MSYRNEIQCVLFHKNVIQCTLFHTNPIQFILFHKSSVQCVLFHKNVVGLTFPNGLSFSCGPGVDGVSTVDRICDKISSSKKT